MDQKAREGTRTKGIRAEAQRTDSNRAATEAEKQKATERD